MAQDASERRDQAAVSAVSDPAALWDAFAPPLRAFLVRRVPAGVEADDLLQDVFVRVVKHFDSLKSTERPEAWLFQIARNALRDSLRARQRKDGRTDPLEIDPPADVDTTAVPESEEELAPCLTPMIKRLAEPYRTAIELTSVHGLTQAEAARQVGVSLSGMKSRVQRGRDQLRQMLVRCCEISVDVRGGVSDFHQRSADACQATPRPSRRSSRCGVASQRLRSANERGDNQGPGSGRPALDK